MEDLLNLASELMKDDNYKKSSFEELPDGEYLVNIDKIELRENDKGTQWIGFTNTVVDGDYSERKMFINMFLTEKTIKRTISAIMNIITSFGYELDTSMFADFDTLVECLQSLINKQATVVKKTNGEFVNYTLRGVEE